MSSVNTGVSMKVSLIRKGYANDVYKSMTYANHGVCQSARIRHSCVSKSNRLSSIRIVFSLQREFPAAVSNGEYGN